MSWKKLLADKRVTKEASSKTELDNLRSIVTRSLKVVAAKGLGALLQRFGAISYDYRLFM